MLKYSPTDPAAMDDPYPFYAALRKGPSATYVEADDLWVVSRYDEVDEALRQPALFSSAAHWALFVGALSARSGPRPDIRALAEQQPKNLIAVDPPVHLGIRRMGAKMFTKRAVDTYEEGIRSISNELVDSMIDRASGQHETDLVAEFNRPLPVRVIARILGVPDKRLADFMRWSDVLIDRQLGIDSDANQHEMRRMIDYFGELLAERRARPGNDLIDLLIVENAQNGSELSDWDLFNFFTLLVVAGHETTTGLLSNLFSALFERSDQMAHVWATDDLSAVVEEALRYETTAQAIPRITTSRVQLRDTIIPEDAIVLLLAGSANRDERRWTNADRFDANRERKSHVGLGNGVHTCLGGSLARLELRVALEVLRTRIRSIELVSPGTRSVTSVLRGFHSLPVRITAR